MAHNISHWCPQTILVYPLDAAKFYGENPLNGSWHSVCWSKPLLQAQECISPNSTIGEFAVTASHGGRIYTIDIGKCCNQFISPRKSVIKHYPDTTGPGGMKDPGGMALLHPL